MQFTLGDDGAQPPLDLIKDATTDSFMADVIEASKTTPVIVDFWANWCGPCKTLTPLLEKAVRAAAGKVKLVKIDVDKNQVLAQQMRVSSIPTVFAFDGGQPVDGFAGALPESQIKAFIDRVTAAGGANAGDDNGEGDLTQALTQAQAALDAGDLAMAANIFGQILKFDQANVEALAGLARCHVAMGDIQQAQQLLELVPPDKKKSPALAGVQAAIALSEELADVGDAEQHRAKLEENANDHQARFDLARALLAKGEREAAADLLLDIIRRQRDWEEGKARALLLKMFDAFGGDDEFTIATRRRLSSILFS